MWGSSWAWGLELQPSRSGWGQKGLLKAQTQCECCRKVFLPSLCSSHSEATREAQTIWWLEELVPRRLPPNPMYLSYEPDPTQRQRQGPQGPTKGVAIVPRLGGRGVACRPLACSPRPTFCSLLSRRRAMKRNIQLRCPFRKGTCEITQKTRRQCQACRLRKCLESGMKKESEQRGAPRRVWGQVHCEPGAE